MKKKEKTSPGKIALKILDALQQNPEGLNIFQIRSFLPEAKDAQEQLGRRLRELDPWYIIHRIRDGTNTVYRYVEARPEGSWDYDDVSKDTRAKIVHKAHGRCQMCGRTINEDEIKLHIDHKIPRSWGGKTADENLWAICSICNEGKKNYFASFDEKIMIGLTSIDSVHKRIAELLHSKIGEWVESDLIEFVANVRDVQADWQKRLRELRYLGLGIETRRRYKDKKVVGEYRLINWVELPEDPTKAARHYEHERAKRRRK